MHLTNYYQVKDKYDCNSLNKNVVIVDPPRKGLDNTTIQNLKKLKIRKACIC